MRIKFIIILKVSVFTFLQSFSQSQVAIVPVFDRNLSKYILCNETGEEADPARFDAFNLIKFKDSYFFELRQGDTTSVYRNNGLKVFSQIGKVEYYFATNSGERIFVFDSEADSKKIVFSIDKGESIFQITSYLFCGFVDHKVLFFNQGKKVKSFDVESGLISELQLPIIPFSIYNVHKGSPDLYEFRVNHNFCRGVFNLKGDIQYLFKSSASITRVGNDNIFSSSRDNKLIKYNLQTKKASRIREGGITSLRMQSDYFVLWKKGEMYKIIDSNWAVIYKGKFYKIVTDGDVFYVKKDKWVKNSFTSSVNKDSVLTFTDIRKSGDLVVMRSDSGFTYLPYCQRIVEGIVYDFNNKYLLAKDKANNTIVYDRGSMNVLFRFNGHLNCADELPIFKSYSEGKVGVVDNAGKQIAGNKFESIIFINEGVFEALYPLKMGNVVRILVDSKSGKEYIRN